MSGDVERRTERTVLCADGADHYKGTRSRQLTRREAKRLAEAVDSYDTGQACGPHAAGEREAVTHYSEWSRAI